MLEKIKSYKTYLMAGVLTLGTASIVSADTATDVEQALTFEFPLEGLGGAWTAALTSFAPLFYLAGGLLLALIVLRVGIGFFNRVS